MATQTGSKRKLSVNIEALEANNTLTLGGNGVATQSWVNTQISNLVASAPATLDTLNELAAALGDDPNFATTVTNSIATKFPTSGGTLTGDLIVGDTAWINYNNQNIYNNYNENIRLRNAGNGVSVIAFGAEGTGGVPASSILSYGDRHEIRIGNAWKQRTRDASIDFSVQLNVTGHGNSSQWNTAYGWGNHANAGYLTSYSETDTLQSVTDRGSTTTNSITVANIIASRGYFGSTGTNPQINIFTENATASIADTFTDTTTDKSYIYFNAGTGSNDPAYIMHETSEDASPDERNEGVLHLVPSDDNSFGDYVSIHGTNDPDCIKLHTNGTIETSSSYQLTLISGSGSVRIDDALSVANQINTDSHGDSSQWNTAYGWGNHASQGYITSSSTAFVKDFGTTAQSNINTVGADSGKYRWNISTAGRPASGQSNQYGTLLHLNYDGSYATQMAYDIDQSNLYIRHLNLSSNTGSTWKRLLTTSDSSSFDAAGSSNAVNDRIDNEVIPLIDTKQDAGSYAAASHNHDSRYYTETESDSRYIPFAGNRDYILAWTQKGAYLYDSTNGSRHKFYKLGQLGTNGGEIVVEVLIKHDVNYWDKAQSIISVSTWNSTSISVQHDSIGAVSKPIRCVIDTERNVYVAGGVEWDSYLSWRFIYKNNFTDTSADDFAFLSDAIPPEMVEIEAGYSIRTNQNTPLATDKFVSEDTIVGHLRTRGSVYTGSHGTSANWKQAYDNYITGISVTGTTTKTITLTQRDGGTISDTFSDLSGAGGDGNDFLINGTWDGGTETLSLEVQNQAPININLSGTMRDTDTNTWRGIHDTPVDGATTTSISSNWAFDNVKTPVPANAVFTDNNTTYTAGTGLTLTGTEFSVTAGTYAAASHTHNYLPLSGGFVTGLTTFSDTVLFGGSTVLGSQAFYTHTVSVGDADGTDVKWTLKNSAGNDVTTTTTNNVYRIRLVTTGTGTNTGAVYICDNVDGAGWRAKKVSSVDTGNPDSNHPFIEIEGGLPKVSIQHNSLYNVKVIIEEFDGGNNGASYELLGLDSGITNENGKLIFNTVDNTTTGTTALMISTSGKVLKRALGSAAFSSTGDFAASSHNHTSLNLTGSIYNGNANYSIDLKDHGDRAWFRNEQGCWTFQAGTSSDDWTQSYTLYLPAAGSTRNNVWAELGQRDSNDSGGGRYRGLRIVKDTGNAVDGDLRAGAIYIGTTRKDSNWDTAYTHSQAAHAPANAQANVQSDWNATSGDAFIQNKPTIPSGNAVIDWTVSQTENIHADNYTNTTYTVGDGGLTEKNFTSTLKTKLDGIAANANNYSHPTGAGNNHIPSGGSAGQFLKYSSSGVAVWATPDYTTNTDTQYSAGSGLDLTGTTFSIEPDLRDGITRIGKDTSNYIAIDADNSNSIDFYISGVWVARMEADGDLHMKGDVVAFSNIFNP